MILMEQNMKHVPEYYPTMCLDGFTPEEIRHAFKRKMEKELANRGSDDSDNEITITTEVRTKK